MSENVITQSRGGRFTIPLPLLEESIEVVQQILAQTVVVGATASMIENAITYEAYCPQFDPVPDGEKPPEYDINVEDDKVTFTKKA